MKIAIQGHPTRGKEVIQIFESLGGINIALLNAQNPNWYYHLDDDNNITSSKISYCNKYGFTSYTLEEFEKEFPFKIGDKVMDYSDNEVGTITNLNYITNKLFYNVDFVNSGQAFMTSEELKPYKEMQEERNITLSLNKAKEWYQKGGELKEVALQAYSEEELIRVKYPKTWKEFCDNYMIDSSEAYFDTCSTILIADKTYRHPLYDRSVCSSKESAEAHLAMMQLEQLRNCWRQGWTPKSHEYVYAIKFSNRGLDIYNFCSREFLSFPTRKMAEDFLECFRDLIEKAKDLI